MTTGGRKTSDRKRNAPGAQKSSLGLSSAARVLVHGALFETKSPTKTDKGFHTFRALPRGALI